MIIDGLTLPNPDDNGLEIEKHYRMLGSESLFNGIKAIALPRYSSEYGGEYVLPRYVVKCTWTDLVAPQYALLETAIERMTVNLVLMQMSGLGADATQPVISGTGGDQIVDAMYVTLASNSPPQIQYVEGYQFYSGVMYGPVLFTVRLQLFGLDIQYLWDA
jgi:hypothetical protein